ncbi:MarR family winged helix-turn-helix transcriptional regulator [Georgenia sp. AZ-5]|uniref:MarR family winged helix-turn-helix transcriptional regulator n=1 Tax=Georgenia sp. AZ-5 TaxID=3367526 RepID=UPI003755076D
MPPQDQNTIAMLGQAYSLFGFRIVECVVGAGYPQKPRHLAVFAQISPDGSRLSNLARGANMTPQSMGEIVDELEELGYVRREPDPSDRRAKLIRLTPLGRRTVDAGKATVNGIEESHRGAGAEGHAELRRLLGRLLASAEGQR